MFLLAAKFSPSIVKAKETIGHVDSGFAEPSFLALNKPVPRESNRKDTDERDTKAETVVGPYSDIAGPSSLTLKKPIPKQK